MDVFLTAEAARTLGAVRRITPGKGSRGFLLGHRRGDRVYVESVLPAPSPSWPTLKAFYEMDAGLGGKIIGFFILGPQTAAGKPLLQPFGMGKVVIKIAGRGGKTPALSAAVIDYRDRFAFRKIPLVAERPLG